MTQAYYTIRGDRMIRGYIDDLGSKVLHVTAMDGAVYEYNAVRRCAETWEAPLVLDADGLVTRAGAHAGYGFLPDGGEMERLARHGMVIPALAA